MKPYIKIIKSLFLMIALAAFFSFSWVYIDTLKEVLKSATTELLVISILIWSALHLLSPLFTKVLLNGLSEKISFNQALQIHANRLPAKYLPGGIWHSIARVEGYHKYGISSMNIGIYLLIENILSAVVTISFGGIMVYFFQNNSSFNLLILAFSLLSIVIVITVPVVVSKKFIIPTFKSHFFYSYIISLFIAYSFWIGAGFSFANFILAMPAATIQTEIYEIVGVYIFSWGIGFISLFAPQGIGVTEYMTSILLPYRIETGAMIVLLASFRVVIFIADLITWLVSLLVLTPISNKMAKLK